MTDKDSSDPIKKVKISFRAQGGYWIEKYFDSNEEANKYLMEQNNARDRETMDVLLIFVGFFAFGGLVQGGIWLYHQYIQQFIG